MKKRILPIILGIFTISLLSVITSCRPFPSAEAHTLADDTGGAGGKGGKEPTSLKDDGTWRITFSHSAGNVTFSRQDGGTVMVNGPWSISGSVKLKDGTTAVYEKPVLKTYQDQYSGCVIKCNFKNKTCEISCYN